MRMDAENEKNAKSAEGLPLEMELDLLVDEELPEGRRRELLLSLDKMPANWRELSIRFLERQTERRSARQMVTGKAEESAGAVKPPREEAPANYPFRRRSWLTPRRISGIAAGLLVAVASALVTVYVMHQATPKQDTISTQLPGSVMGVDEKLVPVTVSVSSAQAGERLFPQEPDVPGSRRSVVIQPNGANNALVIPVRNLEFQ
jgi:hypothetical protein